MTDIVTVLRAVAPRANATFLEASGAAAQIMEVCGIKSATAQAQLIAHLAHETAGFTKFEENLNYSAERLCQVWPSRFKTLAAAQACAKNPKALAINVYGGRMGNRAGTEDGWHYRGSGALQHTGRGEFQRVTKATGVDVTTSPARLRDPKAASVMWQAAASFVVERGALPAFNAGDITNGTRMVNGGHNGLADRKLLFKRATAALAGRPVDVRVKTATEKADDDKRKASQATAGAPVGGLVGGGGGQWAGADFTVVVIIGLCVAVVVAAVATVMWRKAFASQDEVEAQEIEAIKAKEGVPA